MKVARENYFIYYIVYFYVNMQAKSIWKQEPGEDTLRKV